MTRSDKIRLKFLFLHSTKNNAKSINLICIFMEINCIVYNCFYANTSRINVQHTLNFLITALQ